MLIASNIQQHHDNADHDAQSRPSPAREHRKQQERKQSQFQLVITIAIQIAHQVSKQTGPVGRGTLDRDLTVDVCRIPLNDDAQEKAARLHSRQALHEKQINQLKAAASTPLRKTSVNLNDLENASPGSNPRTPRARPSGKENLADDDDVVIGGSAVTPMKRVPILANFEEWMKMATDNKINATNSWNFALIDYFHDMSLLKEGNGVNFQKASCTLDGCVKIYTSRIDSVATETGKLLSGLADSRDSKKKDRDGEEGEGEESEEEVDEDGVVRKKPKKKASIISCSYKTTFTNKFTDTKIVRSHSGAFICLIAAEEV